MDHVGLDALDAGQVPGVVAHLNDRRGLHLSRELGVGHLVAEAAHLTRRVDTYSLFSARH